MDNYLAGIDEAGKGSVIADMVFACVVMKQDVLEKLTLKDSKKLSDKKREELYKIIKNNAEQIIVINKTSKEITELQNNNINLNRIGVLSFAECIKSITTENTTIYVDAADVIAERFGKNIKDILKRELELISEHKADDKYPIVSAASIVAKHYREKSVRKLKKIYGDFGSGYPNKCTMDWIENYYKENGEMPDCVRMNWKNVKKILE